MTTRYQEPTVMSVDFGDPAIVEDPWDTLEEIRAQGPVVYNDLLDAWMVSGYTNVARMLANARSFTTERLGESYAQLFGGNTMQFDDTVRHDEIKAVWAKQFQRGNLAELREMITEVVDQRLLPFVDRLRAGERLDARTYLTRGIPTLVIARMMGLPEERFEEFGRWSDAMGGDPRRGGRCLRARARGGACRAGGDGGHERVPARRDRGAPPAPDRRPRGGADRLRGGEQDV